MTSSVRLSIIVPVHGALEHLAEALGSIRAQKADRCEEPPDEVVGQILPGALILRQANAGPAAARNRGLRAASGEFIAFLDADDRWTEGALAALEKGFRDAPRADVVQGHVRRFGELAPGGERPEPPYLGFNVGALMVRRQALFAAGLFDETLRMSEDVDLFMRLDETGARRLTIPDVVLGYRRHAASMTALTPPRVLGQGAPENWIRLLHNSRARRAAAPMVRKATEAPPYCVVMVVKDGRRYLPAALDSIRRQSVPPREIVAVVGPSIDDTLACLLEQADVRVVLQTGAGLAEARNLGIAQSREDLIAFLDHDDLWKPRKLEMQLEQLGLFDGPAACITGFRLVRDTGDPTCVEAVPDDRPRLGWTPSALLAHRDLFRTIGGFDPATGMGCDSDWFRRLQLARAPCAVASGVLLDKRVHAGALSRDVARNRAAMFQILRKHRLEGRGS